MRKFIQTSNTTESDAHRSASYIFGIMFGINLLNYLNRYIFSSMATTIAKDLHFGLNGIGFIASAFLIVYTLCTLPLGILADTMKKKHLIALCTIVWSFSMIFAAFVNNFLTLFLSRMILGIGEAGYYPAGTALFSTTFPESKWGKVMSWWNVGATLGLMIGFILGGLLSSLLPQGWRLAFVVTSLPGLILGVLVWRFPAENTASTLVHTEKRTFTSTVKDAAGQAWNILHIRSFILLTVMQIFAFFFLGVAVIFLPTYLQQKDAFGMNPSTAGLYSGLMVTVASITGTVVGGLLADYWRKRFLGAHILICGLGFLVGGVMFALTMISTNLIAFTIFLFWTLFFVNMYNGPVAAATQQVVPQYVRATAIALSMLIAHLFGDSFAPSIIGVITNDLDPTHGQHFFLNMAGQDLRLTLLASCPASLVLAGLFGIWGMRYARSDQARYALSRDIAI